MRCCREVDRLRGAAWGGYGDTGVGRIADGEAAELKRMIWAGVRCCGEVDRLRGAAGGRTGTWDRRRLVLAAGRLS